MARVMPPRWRRKKPDTPGLWALYRTAKPEFMTIRVTNRMLEDSVPQWRADWWMRLPDLPAMTDTTKARP